MADRGSGEPNENGGMRIGRRGFIGAGLVGAGALLTPAELASARSVSATQAAAAQPSVANGAPSAGGAIGRLSTQAAFPNLPAIPEDPAGALDTLARLSIRAEQVVQAKQGMTRRFRIRGTSNTGYAFLFGQTGAATASVAQDALARRLREEPDRALLASALSKQADAQSAAAGAKPLSLERPEQFSIAWTTFPDIYGAGQPHLRTWAASLTNADSATRQFWPMIAQNGVGFNLIIPERVTATRARDLRRTFRIPWTRTLRNALAAGNLYVIDMSRFETLQPNTIGGAVRFTPSTVTLLTRNPRTKTLTPVAIVVSGYQGHGRRVYTRANATSGAWLYALQAAKASITVYGIWLGHVYHWHIVTAAMQMTMYSTLPTNHPVYQLLAPQSNFVIPFDDVLLALWSQIAPPTSLSSGPEFLALANDFAAGRSYFDDDPRSTLKALGLRQGAFTRRTAWDQYPVVGRLLRVWDLVAAYVRTCVRATYPSDAAVAGDRALQNWIATASASSGGNVRGLPAMNGRSALERVLTSMLYRVTVHGVARLTSTSSPALTFVANFPHCLQRADIPGPRTRINTRTLLTYLPNVQTISQAVSFYFTFTFSTPYESFIPLGGANTQLFFPGGPGDPRNRALIKFRNGLASFIIDYQPDDNQRFQWPLNIET